MKKQITNYTPEEKMAKIEDFSLRSNEICANNNNRKLGKAVISVPRTPYLDNHRNQRILHKASQRT